MSSQEIFEFGRIGTPQHWLYAGMVGALLMGAVFSLYRRDLRGLSTAVATLLVAFRVAAMAMVAWVALDPRTVVETTVVQQPRIAVLVDRSASMKTPDVDDAGGSIKRVSRWDQAIRTFNDPRLAELRAHQRDVEVFSFGGDLNPVADMAALRESSPVEGETRLGGAIIEALGSRNHRPPAAVVLATDGGLNAGPTLDETLAAARSARAPIYSVVFGSERPLPNLRIVDLRLPGRVFRGSDDVSGTAMVDAIGDVVGPVEIVFEAKRLDGGGATVVLGKQSATFTPSNRSATVPIVFSPRDAGRWEVTARTDVRPNELRSDDNRAAATVDVVDRKTKVLLIAGSSTREYQFLRSVLFRDKSVELSVWLQPGRPGVSQDAQKVLEKFPADRADLFSYDVLVAVDPDWRAVDDQGLRNLTDWVGGQAAGVVFVAGQTNWMRLAPDSPIVTLSPVAPRRAVLEASNAQSTELQTIAFSREGEASRPFSLNDDAVQSKKLWGEFAGVFWVADVDRLKPGATLLATARPQGTGTASAQGVPLIASQFYGAGRVLYLGTGELWRLRRTDERLFERLWTQLVRHVGEGRLLRGSKRGGFLVDERRIPAGNDLPIKAFVLDEQFQPLRTAKLTASAATSLGPREVGLEPVVGQPGRFQGLLPNPPAGPVKLQLPLPGGGVLEESFTVRESRTETDDVRVRRDVLERLASASGGKVFDPSQIDQLTSLLPTDVESTVLTSPPRPLWDRPWVVLAFVGLLAAEWITRKWNRLA
jgi:hypothetical protein